MLLAQPSRARHPVPLSFLHVMFRPVPARRPLAVMMLAMSGLADAAEPAQASDITLPAVSVTGTATASYNPPDASGATRTDTPLREIPQSVRVVPRAMLDDIAATRFDQTFDYVSGVARQNNFGGLWDNFAMRGFTGHENTGAGYLVNGFAANRGYTAPLDAATIDRVEVLKGPTSSLYGSSEPGGTFNVVTRQPQFRPAQRYGFELGTRDGYRATADVTGPLGEDVAGRLIAVADHQGSTRDFIHSQRYLVAPSFTWMLGNDTILQYAAEFQRYTTPMDRGVVAVNGQLGRIPRSRFLGEPGDGSLRLDSQSHQLSVEHQFLPQWKGRLAVSYRGGALAGHSSEASSLAADGRTLWRQHRYRDFQSDDVALQASVTGKFSTGLAAHELLLGVDAYRFGNTMAILRKNPSAAAPYAIDIYNPVYGQPTPPLAWNMDTYERQHNVGAYVQDQISLGERWRVLAGVRFDSFSQSLDDHLRGTRTTQHHNAVSPRVGVSYLASNNLSLFANASQSFRPNAGTDAAGQPFDPERGRALEAGIKFDSDDRRTGATLAVFEIRKRNVLAADPADPSFYLAAGEARSRGVELDVAGQLGTHWRVSGSFALTDAEITQDTRLAPGTPLSNVPRTSASLLAMYEDAAPVGQRYGAGAGLRYVGQRPGDVQDSFSLPAYVLVDLHGYWQYSRHVRVSLNVGNLFDKTYYASSYSSLWVAPGAGRSVRLGVQLSY
ncbi:TonB-dependent siderophore receptor [Cupriavidus taiwanensis]|uniref:TonB-dependent siderophore receptor n=1 Tax=Cupriavidus taiwanensis TaxID=164546 RepID=UPI000E1B239B|nr:TonB-dependent siderophore receptor [Cupriavidus taiwanensis]SPC17571.1 TonB-dependent siderophore receptor, FERRICHROME-IRON RECEPTOR [Cupriavidus taiwanensis]